MWWEEKEEGKESEAERMRDWLLGEACSVRTAFLQSAVSCLCKV